jgi:diguanylate cyclase (GGDEF)-like protein
LQIHVANNRNIVVVSSDFDQIGKPLPVLADAGSRFWRTADIYTVGSIAIQFSNDQLAAATRSVRKFGTTIALIGISIIALAGLLMGYWLTRRLTILTTAAQKFERGDSSVRIQFRGCDEIAVLGNTFEQMRGKIDQYIEQLEKDKTELKQARDLLEVRVEERTAELSKLNAKLLKLSEYDELTQLYNRRKFDEYMQREYWAAKRNNHSLSLAIIDIDYFKLYNDNYGHATADKVLAKVAACLKDTLKRPADILARYGGEEFAAILPSTDSTGAFSVADALRANVEALLIPHDYSKVKPHVTVSVGIAVLEQKCTLSPEKLFEYADKALYDAKAKGRNRVQLYKGSEVVSLAHVKGAGGD